jgi:hypothetical protein
VRAIYCPGVHDPRKRWVPLRVYIAGVRLAKANPTAWFPHGLTSEGPTTGAEIVSQFWHGVEDRINQAVPYLRRGAS